MTSTTVGHDPITTGPAARPPSVITTATRVFLAGLVGRLGGVRSHEPWSLVLLGAGVVFAAATAIAAVGLDQVSGAITFGGGPAEYPIPKADVLRQSEQLGFGIGLAVFLPLVLLVAWAIAMSTATRHLVTATS